MGVGTSSSALRRTGLYQRMVSVIGALLLGWELRLSLALALARTEHREVLRASLRGAEPRPAYGEICAITQRVVGRGPTSIPFVGLAKPALRVLNGVLITT